MDSTLLVLFAVFVSVTAFVVLRECSKARRRVGAVVVYFMPGEIDAALVIDKVEFFPGAKEESVSAARKHLNETGWLSRDQKFMLFQGSVNRMDRALIVVPPSPFVS